MKIVSKLSLPLGLALVAALWAWDAGLLGGPNVLDVYAWGGLP